MYVIVTNELIYIAISPDSNIFH